MSIADRLDDARLLYEHGRFEGAFMSVLSAAAGTSSLRFPKGTRSFADATKGMPDNERFTRFLEGTPPIAGALVRFDRECTSVASILYKFLRCTLMHGGRVHRRVQLSEGSSEFEARIDCETAAPNVIITHPIIMMLAHAIATCPENGSIPVGKQKRGQAHICGICACPLFRTRHGEHQPTPGRLVRCLACWFAQSNHVCVSYQYRTCPVFCCPRHLTGRAFQGMRSCAAAAVCSD